MTKRATQLTINTDIDHLKNVIKLQYMIKEITITLIIHTHDDIQVGCYSKKQMPSFQETSIDHPFCQSNRMRARYIENKTNDSLQLIVG